jgi:predicted PurR-regulated permease PerM
MTIGYMNAQTNRKDTVSTKVSFCLQDSTRFNKIDSVTENISKQLNTLQEKAELINKTVETIDDNTNDSYFTEAAKNYSFSLIYEFLGYKSETSTNWISRIVSILSFLFLVIRIYFFFNKDEKHKALKGFLNGYFILLAFIALLLPWTSSILPNKEVDKTQILRITESTKKLNDEIEKVKAANFNELINNIQELQKLRFDTIQVAKESSIKAFDTKFNLLQSQLIQANKKLDSISEKVNNDKNENNAKRGQQVFQTWLVVLTFLMVLVFFIFFISKKPWDE